MGNGDGRWLEDNMLVVSVVAGVVVLWRRGEEMQWLLRGRVECGVDPDPPNVGALGNSS